MHICATEYTILASLFPVWSHPLCFVYAAAAAALPVYFLIEEGSRIFWNPVPQPISPDFSCSFLLLLRNLAAAPCHTDGVHTAYTWPAIHGRCGRCGRWFIFIYINCFIRLFVCGMRSRAVYGTHCIAISMIMYTNRKIACIFAIFWSISQTYWLLVFRRACVSRHTHHISADLCRFKVSSLPTFGFASVAN